MSTRKKPAATPARKAPPKKGTKGKVAVKAARSVKSASGAKSKPKPSKSAPAPRTAARVKKAASPKPSSPKKSPVTAKKDKPAKSSAPKAEKKTKPESSPKVEKPVSPSVSAPVADSAAKPKTPRTTLDDLALDVEEKDRLVEEEKRELAKALREDDEDEPLETAFVPTDTSERYILVVDEEGQRRTETVTIVQQILPNAVVEVADDPDEALDVIQEAEFDTYVVNFLMPGFSASPFVKAVANHPDHPLLIGFAADKISDALDQRKGLKIIPLKRLFDLDVNPDAAKARSGGADD